MEKNMRIILKMYKGLIILGTIQCILLVTILFLLFKENDMFKKEESSAEIISICKQHEIPSETEEKENVTQVTSEIEVQENNDDIDHLKGLYIYGDQEVKRETNFAIVRDSKNFTFYNSAKKLKAVEFPGEHIQNQVFEDGYIVDSKNDLYYYYYNADSANPDMQFLKAASNIDKIVRDGYMDYGFGEALEDGNSVDDYYFFNFKFPIYQKDGKEFLTYSYCWLEEKYGFFNCHTIRPIDSINLNDINTITFCLDDSKMGYEFDINSSEKECVIVYYYYVQGKHVKSELEISSFGKYKISDDIVQKLKDYEGVISEKQLSEIKQILAEGGTQI